MGGHERFRFQYLNLDVFNCEGSQRWKQFLKFETATVCTDEYLMNTDE